MQDFVNGGMVQPDPTRQTIGISLFGYCGAVVQPAYRDPLVSTVQSLEFVDRRELLTFTTADYMDEVRNLVQGCPTTASDEYGAMVDLVPHEYDLGYDSFTFDELIRGDLCCGTYQLLRVGAAVLVRFVGGEASSRSNEAKLRSLATVALGIGTSMCVFTATGCA